MGSDCASGGPTTAIPTSAPTSSNAVGLGVSRAAKASKKRSIPDGVKWKSIRAGPSPTFCQACGVRLRARRRDASDGAGSPGLARVGEPDGLGVERKDPLPAFGGRLAELAEPPRHIAADDARAPASLDDDHLHAGCVARRRDEAEP